MPVFPFSFKLEVDQHCFFLLVSINLFFTFFFCSVIQSSYILHSAHDAVICFFFYSSYFSFLFFCLLLMVCSFLPTSSGTILWGGVTKSVGKKREVCEGEFAEEIIDYERMKWMGKRNVYISIFYLSFDIRSSVDELYGVSNGRTQIGFNLSRVPLGKSYHILI
ncbi:hypothetical protein BZA77DRAFT_301371 [Pyronema omphalodes]|nr:hypothetical protein BZA77DRAFT_301371 [Pyronema omphalodes]